MSILSMRTAHLHRLSIPWWAQCVLVWLVLVVCLTLAGYVGARFLIEDGGYEPSIANPPNTWPGVWVRWDSGYYYAIASEGYLTNPDALGFFPVYPMLIATMSAITGWKLITSGVILAQLTFLAALILLYKLGRLIQDDHWFAMRAVVLMAIFPSAFFCMAMYAESLGLALSLLATYFVLQGRFLRGGLALCVATATRPVAWLLMIVVGVEFLYRRRYDFTTVSRVVIALALAATGIVGFLVYLYLITGNIGAAQEAQALWKRSWQFPLSTVAESVSILFSGNGVANDWFLYVSNMSDLLFTLFAVVMTLLAIKRLPPSLTIYLALALIFLLCSRGPSVVPLWGMTRWVGALFPLYFVMADLAKRKVVFWPVAILSGVTLFGLTVWWASGRWVG